MTWQSDWQQKFRNDSENLVDRYCVARSDGCWDYYPNGFKRPGFVLDATRRQRLIDARGNLAGPMMVITVATVGFGIQGSRLISEIVPALSLYARSGVIRWSVVGLVGVILMLSLTWIQQWRARRILANAETATKTYTAEQILELRHQTRAMAARGRRNSWIFLIVIFGSAFVACCWLSFDRFQQRATISVIEGGLMAVWAVLFGLFLFGLLVRARPNRRDNKAT